MKNKGGNIATIAIIITIVAITIGVITWLVAKKSQLPVQQVVITQPAAQTQPINQTGKTDSWKIYKDGRFGFEVKYPSQFTAMKEIDSDRSANMATIYFATNDIVEKIKSNPKSSDSTIVDNVWNDLVETYNVDKTFSLDYYNQASQNASDAEYQKDFVDSYSGLINGNNFSAKTVSFKKIDTASGAQARVIVGEQWKEENTSNILINKIFEAQIIKGNWMAKFSVNTPASNSALISLEQFEKVVSSLKLN